MGFWNYCPEDVDILLAGVYKVEGYDPDTFISISKDVQPFTTTRSVDGKVYRNSKNDQTYTVDITLLSTSPSNDVFTKLWLLDETTSMCKFPLLVKDHLGTGKFFSTTTWIENVPDLAYGNNPKSTTWRLRSSQGIINIGGNEPESTLGQIATLIASGLPLVTSAIKDLKWGA